MEVRDDGPAAADTSVLVTGNWMINALRSVKGISADNKELNAGGHVCDRGIEQVERHILEKHWKVGTMG